MRRREAGDLGQFPEDLTIFTICASNYLAHASVLGASVRAHHPGLTLIVFLLDDPPARIILPEHLIIVPAEMAFERKEWNHRRCHYSILEFATSVKPACFRHLFDKGVQRAIYLDPDIRLFQRVDQCWKEDATDAALVLTPHILSPLPDDGHQPDDLGIMRAGLYNLGFAALRNTKGARSLLEWWDNKLHTLCLEDTQKGVFTDQKWMDYAPLLLPGTAVLQHLGFNIAYWNLHERIPRCPDNCWRVEGRAGDVHDLVFFHFSGFVPGQKQLSRYENRFGWRLPGDARRLFDDYADALSNAGLSEFRAIGIPQPVFDDGTGWDPACRALYRQSLAEGLDLGDPLDASGFLDWAGSIAPGDHVTRYIRAVLRMRGDIAAAFGDGRDAAGLMAWLRSSGAREVGLDAVLVERFGCPGGTCGTSVHYVGYLRSHLGVGEAARNSVAALEAVGIAVQCHDISHSAAAPAGMYVLPGGGRIAGAPTVTILGCNADALPNVLSDLPPDLLATYRIGCWYWETPTFPEQWVNRFDLLDEVWVASRFVADAIREKATVPVVVMPPMVTSPSARRDRAWLITLLPDVAADEFIFLFQFDIASVPFRKNPEGVLAAFSEAFSPNEAVRLVLKCLNGQAAPELMQALRTAARGRRVSFLEQALESADRFRLLASVDSFVSLHRAEGFGLSIAEAMAYGLPVVITGWSGNLDFTHAGNAALVPYDLIPTEIAHGPYPAGTLWAEPRLDEAARLMRRVWTDPVWRAAIGRAGSETVAKTLSAEAVGVAMRARLERIARSVRVTARAQGRSAARPREVSAARGTPLIVRVTSDMLRFPGYYLARLPRLPALLWRDGVAGMLKRAGVVASGAPAIKARYRLQLIPRMLAGFQMQLRRWRHDRWR